MGQLLVVNDAVLVFVQVSEEIAHVALAEVAAESVERLLKFSFVHATFAQHVVVLQEPLDCLALVVAAVSALPQLLEQGVSELDNSGFPRIVIVHVEAPCARNG